MKDVFDKIILTVRLWPTHNGRNENRIAEKYVDLIINHISLRNGVSRDFVELQGVQIKEVEPGKTEIWLDLNTHEEKARVFSFLRDKGCAFSYGQGWAPSEVFEYYREKNFLKGSYKRIAWVNPNSFTIEDL